jgi:hypothetical protein
MRKTTPLYTIDLLSARSGEVGEYVLSSDQAEMNLADEQVARAIRIARAGGGKKIISATGSIERYVDLDDVDSDGWPIAVPVLGCRR